MSEETETGEMEETLVEKDSNEDKEEDNNSDTVACIDEPPAYKNEAVCERFTDSDDPSGSLHSTLRELMDGSIVMQEDNGASAGLLLQSLSA